MASKLANIHPGGGRLPMKKELFDELLESVRAGGEILRGERKPARSFVVGEPDVRRLRDELGSSQAKFAALMGIRVATLRNWEQGRRQPEGSARVLLRVVARHPEAVLEAVSAPPARPLPAPRPSRRSSRQRPSRSTNTR